MKGIFLWRSSMGYTVHIDDHTMDLDVSWSEANKLATDIAALRNKSGRYDGRGYARCRHEGNKACWDALEHLPTFELAHDDLCVCGSKRINHGGADGSGPCKAYGRWCKGFQAAAQVLRG